VATPEGYSIRRPIVKQPVFTVAQQRRNVETLARFLERHVPRRKLNMQFFEDIIAGCGTVCCALGWAVKVPTLRKHGLGQDKDPREFRPTLNGREIDPLDLAREAFGRDSWEALFTTHLGRITPKQWAKRARRWLRETA
jgi:hypothetical protein